MRFTREMQTLHLVIFVVCTVHCFAMLHAPTLTHHIEAWSSVIVLKNYQHSLTILGRMSLAVRLELTTVGLAVRATTRPPPTSSTEKGSSWPTWNSSESEGTSLDDPS